MGQSTDWVASLGEAGFEVSHPPAHRDSTASHDGSVLSGGRPVAARRLAPEGFLLPDDRRLLGFVLLTTLGYGDVTPASSYARTLAIFDAFVGQLYLAVFIAQLVGMRLAERLDARCRN